MSRPIEPPCYYMLRCNSCKIDFTRLLATSEAELLHPADYEEVAEQAGTQNANALESFHAQHRGHDLVAIPDPLGNPQGAPQPPATTGSQTKRKSP